MMETFWDRVVVAASLRECTKNRSITDWKTVPLMACEPSLSTEGGRKAEPWEGHGRGHAWLGPR